MKTKLFIVLFLLGSRIVLANTPSTLDSLRQIVLMPKIVDFQKKVKTYSELISTTQDAVQRKHYAKLIINETNFVKETIKELYGYGTVSSISPVYIGANSVSAMYPNVGGFIFPVTYSTVGTLPNIYDEIDYIKGYAWRIRVAVNKSMVEKNLERLNKRNFELVMLK